MVRECCCEAGWAGPMGGQEGEREQGGVRGQRLEGTSCGWVVIGSEDVSSPVAENEGVEFEEGDGCCGRVVEDSGF